jgi:hypothetical protein
MRTRQRTRKIGRLVPDFSGGPRGRVPVTRTDQCAGAEGARAGGAGRGAAKGRAAAVSPVCRTRSVVGFAAGPANTPRPPLTQARGTGRDHADDGTASSSLLELWETRRDSDGARHEHVIVSRGSIWKPDPGRNPPKMFVPVHTVYVLVYVGTKNKK